MIDVATWGEIKKMAEALGVTDDSKIFYIDIGPHFEKLYISKDKIGVEIVDDPIHLESGVGG